MTKTSLNSETKGESGYWCAVDIKNVVVRAQIVHIGRGRFRILKDNQDGAYEGHVVDASDVINCDK